MAVDIDGVNSTISTDKLIPQSGTALQIGESGDTVTLVGTASGFGGGKVLQSVSSIVNTEFSFNTVIPQDNTIPAITEGTEILTRAITPTSATSNLHIAIHVQYGLLVGTSRCFFALFVGGTTDALQSGYDWTGQGEMAMVSFNHIVASGSTSARTYSVRAGPSSSGVTVKINKQGDDTSILGGTVRSGIIVTEIEV